MERRREPRHSCNWWVSFFGDGVIGNGQVYNLSQEGCAIGGRTSVSSESRLRLLLYFQQGVDPVAVEVGAVRWSSVNKFGVQFVVMSASQQQRLRQVVAELAGGSPGN